MDVVFPNCQREQTDQFCWMNVTCQVDWTYEIMIHDVNLYGLDIIYDYITDMWYLQILHYIEDFLSLSNSYWHTIHCDTSWVKMCADFLHDFYRQHLPSWRPSLGFESFFETEVIVKKCQGFVEFWGKTWENTRNQQWLVDFIKEQWLVGGWLILSI